MKDFVIRDAIVPSLQSTDRAGVIRELVNALAAAGVLPKADRDAVAAAVNERERSGTTGFGKGVAVPHIKHDRIPRMMAAIGRSPGGIDFAALDRAPVYSVVLLLSPASKPDEHLQAMESIFRHLQRDNFRRFLRQAESLQAVLDLIEEADELPAG
jgi:mannitol/fructose-specific phosphotransferase system IIA component (Ntr-type)